ncbi:uncharacterized protein LOC118203895 [Stegodyphus dumicola]|uniref:uncharacterized protein LOC118203895 n=1 Tax=Stegodyphus dumicola TaxID=202533 RepID=UPI0015A79791|nr:uncharacterized protein LOC118203895 [Stegodyphus dumicola]
MGGCAAPNCSNQSKNNFRMFRFPRNEERRRKWIVNSRRDQWIPGPGAYLCERLKGIGLPKHRSVTSNFCNGGLLHSLPLSTEAISVAEPSVVHLPQPSASYFGEINFAAEVSDVCLQEQASTSSCDKMPSICEGSHVCLQEQPLASFCNEIPSICEGSDDVLLRTFIKQQTELI